MNGKRKYGKKMKFSGHPAAMNPTKTSRKGAKTKSYSAPSLGTVKDGERNKGKRVF